MARGAWSSDPAVIQPCTGERIRALMASFAWGIRRDMARRFAGRSQSGVARGTSSRNAAMINPRTRKRNRAAMAIFTRRIGRHMFRRLAGCASSVVAADATAGRQRMVKLRCPIPDHARDRSKCSSACPWRYLRESGHAGTWRIESWLEQQARRPGRRI